MHTGLLHGLFALRLGFVIMPHISLFFSSVPDDAMFPHDWEADGILFSGFGSSGIPCNATEWERYKNYRLAVLDHDDYNCFDLAWERDWKRGGSGARNMSRLTEDALHDLWEHWDGFNPPSNLVDPYLAYAKDEAVAKELESMVKTCKLRREREGSQTGERPVQKQSQSSSSRRSV